MSPACNHLSSSDQQSPAAISCNIEQVDQELLTSGVSPESSFPAKKSRIFFSRLLDFLREIPKHHVAPVSVPDYIQADVNWWLEFAPKYNGVSMMPPLKWEAPDKIFSVDACLMGAGGFSMDSPSSAMYFHCAFPENVKLAAQHINGLEIFTIRMAVMLWGERFSGKNILIYSDNQCSVELINRGKSTCRFMQNCLRDILFVAARNEFQIRIEHLSSEANRKSDLLSRVALNSKNLDLFLQENSHLTLHECEISQELFDITCKW